MVSVAKLVDVPDCDSGAARREGSSPFVHPMLFEFECVRCDCVLRDVSSVGRAAGS